MSADGDVPEIVRRIAAARERRGRTYLGQTQDQDDMGGRFASRLPLLASSALPRWIADRKAELRKTLCWNTFLKPLLRRKWKTSLRRRLRRRLRKSLSW